MRWIVLIVMTVMLFGGEIEKQKYFHLIMQKQNPYIFDKKERVEVKKAQIAAQTKENIAKIEYKKAVDVARIAKEKEIQKTQLAVIPQKMQQEVKSKMAFYAFLFGIGTLAVIFVLSRRYHIYKERIELEKMRLQEQLHRKEMMMREKELQAQVAQKLIDAVSSGKLTKEQEEKLLQLTAQNKILPPLKED